MRGLSRAGIIYLTLTLTAAFGVLGATLWLYIVYDRGVPETFSAAVVNTAATLAAATFVGVFDMFFTIQQLRKNEEDRRRWDGDRERWDEDRKRWDEDRKQWQEGIQKERAEANVRLERLLEEARIEREQARAQQEEARAQQEEARAQQEQNQQHLANLLAQNLELNNRLLELLERRNGNSSAV